MQKAAVALNGLLPTYTKVYYLEWLICGIKTDLVSDQNNCGKNLVNHPSETKGIELGFNSAIKR